MNLDLTEDQAMLQTAVRDFAEEVIRPRAAIIDQTGEFPKDLFYEAGKLGLAGVSVPPEHGGSGMDVVAYSIVIEEISRVCANMGVILSVNNSLVCDPRSGRTRIRRSDSWSLSPAAKSSAASP